MATPRELRSRRSRMAQTQRRDLAQFIGKRFDVETAHRFELRMRGAACAHEVRVIRVRKPVRIRTGRSEDGALFQD